MNPRQQKNGTSKALPKRKKSNSNAHKNCAQASGSDSAQVLHSMILPEVHAQREEEESSDTQEEDEGGNEDEDEEDSNPDEIPEDSLDE